MNEPRGVELSTEIHTFRLAGGERVTVRAIRPQDAGRLQDYMRGLSDGSRRNRFLGAVNELPPALLDRLAHMRGPGELALIAFAGGGECNVIAEAIQVMAPGSRRCEIALSVADAWQGRGLGMLMLGDMECRARSLGARHLIGDVLRTNAPMKGLARKAGFAVSGASREARLIGIVKDLAAPPIGLPRAEQFAESMAA
jgi:GNAT superfamily N-acetyltransferase